MVRIITDTKGCIVEATGEYRSLNTWIHIEDVIKRPESPSYTALKNFRKYFRTEQEYNSFFNGVISTPTGSAVGGELYWTTPDK